MCLMLFSKACGFVKDVNWRKFRVTFWEGGGACGPCMLLCRAYWGNFGYGRIKYQLLSLNWQFFLFVQQSAIIKIQFLWLQHCTSSKLTWVYMAGLSQAGGGPGGHVPTQFLADQLTLSQPAGAHYPHPVLRALPDFQTLRRPCGLTSVHLGCIYWFWFYN